MAKRITIHNNSTNSLGGKKKKVNYLTPNQNQNETQTKDGFVEGKQRSEKRMKLTYVKGKEITSYLHTK